VVTVQKEYMPDEVRMLVGKAGWAIKALMDCSGCAVKQDRFPPIGSTAVAISFRGTLSQVELAIEMVRELHAAYRAAHFAVQHTVAPDVAERWRRAAVARAAGVCAAGEAPEVVSKGGRSVDKVIGNAGHAIASNLPAMEAAPRAAARGDGVGRSPNKKTAPAKTWRSILLPKGVIGLILGSRGAMKHNLSDASGCDISIKKRPPPGVGVQKVTFYGTQAQIDLAVEMVQVLISQGCLNPLSYVSKHAKKLEPSSSGSPPLDEGRKRIVGPFSDPLERLVRRAATAEDVSLAPSSSVAPHTASSSTQSSESTASVLFGASVGTPQSNVSTNTSACGEVESAGHPRRQSIKRCAPAESADGERGRRVRGGRERWQCWRH